MSWMGPLDLPTPRFATQRATIGFASGGRAGRVGETKRDGVCVCVCVCKRAGQGAAGGDLIRPGPGLSDTPGGKAYAADHGLTGTATSLALTNGPGMTRKRVPVWRARAFGHGVER